MSGTDVAFRGVGSGEEGIYLSSGGSLKGVADLTTSIPGGTGSITGFSDFPALGGELTEPPVLSGGKVAFRASRSSGQAGIYSFAGSGLSRVADRNTKVPSGAMPRVRVEIKNRDPQSRPAEFAVAVDRDRISTPVACAIERRARRSSRRVSSCAWARSESSSTASFRGAAPAGS